MKKTEKKLIQKGGVAAKGGMVKLRPADLGPPWRRWPRPLQIPDVAVAINGSVVY